ncbi:MAG: SRPBCC family protein [Actinomycetota bacterium]
MSFITASIPVDAPGPAVWHTFADFGGVSDWHPYFESAHLDDPRQPTGVGASRTCVFGPRMAIRETVTGWTENERMTIGIEFLSGPPMPITDIEAAVIVSEQAEGGPTDLTLTMAYEPRWGPIGRILDALMVRRMYEDVFAEMLPAAKAYTESGTRPEPVAMLGSGRRL